MRNPLNNTHSAMPTLTPTQFQQIVQLLSPHLDRESSRHALVDSAFGIGANANAIKHHLDFSGTTHDFTTQLVKELSEYGQLDDGELALVRLLRTAQQQVGIDKAKAYTAIIATLQQSPANQDASPSQKPNGARNKVSRAAIITAIVGIVGAILAGVAQTLVQDHLETRRVTRQTATAVAMIQTQTAAAPTLTPTQLDPTATETTPPTLTHTVTPTATLTPTQLPTETATNIPPTATAIPPSATSVSLPTNTAIPAPTQPPIVTNRSFPCEGTVAPTATSSILNVVRQFPNPNASIVDSVRRGEIVTVLDNSAGSTVYYEIQSGGRTIGWIAQEYLVLSETCPAS